LPSGTGLPCSSWEIQSRNRSVEAEEKKAEETKKARKKRKKRAAASR